MLTIIFSDNTPEKLKLTLRSLKNLSENKKTVVVYNKAITQKINEKFNKLKNDFNDYYWLSPLSVNNMYKNNIVELLKKEQKNEKNVLFLTAGDIIFDKINIKDVENALNDPELLCFSIRLGKNITFCNRLKVQNIIKPYYEDNQFIKWNWKLHYLDFGYPFSLNGHVFRLKEISKLIKKTNFTDSQLLETNLQQFDTYPKDKMVSFIKSKCIFSLNEESEITQNTIIDYIELKNTKTIEKKIKLNERE